MDQFFDILVLNDDVLGYKVTLQPELSNAQYIVKFTPIPAGQNRFSQNPNATRQESFSRISARPTQIRRPSNDQIFRRYGQPLRRYPLVETILQAVAEAEKAEHTTETVPGPSGTSSQQQNRVEVRSPQVPPRRRRFTASHDRRRRRRRRRGRRSVDAATNRETESEESMYEVLDVDFEKITDLKAEPPKDWRIIPRYQLSAKETNQQEKDLFFSMTKDERPEEVQKVKDGEPGCCVCFENLATRVVIPCGHRCLCRPCAFNIATSRSVFGGKRLPKLCPICQAAIAVMPRLC